MKKILLIALFAIGFVGISNFCAKAQTDPTESHNVTVVIPTILELSAASGAINTFTFTNGAELIAGKTVDPAFTLDYKTNSESIISVKAGAANFTGGTTPMPAGVLTISGTGVTSTTLSTTDQPLKSGIAKGDGTVPLTYKITPGLEYSAASYNLEIVYTITGS